MEYRFLGASGLEVSALPFGARATFGSQMDERRAADCMHTAFDAGDVLERIEAVVDNRPRPESDWR